MSAHHPNLWIACLFTCFNFYLFAQAPQQLISENFNDCSLPADWQANISGDGPGIWYVNTPSNPNSDGSSIDGTCMLIMDDDAGGNNTPPYNIEFLTPFFDGSSFSTLTLDADVHFKNYDGSASLTFYVTNGTDYYEVAKFQDEDGHTGEEFSEFLHLNVDLSFYASPNMAISIQYNDGGQWVYWAGIDNFSVTGSGTGSNVLSENFDQCEMPPGWTTEVLKGNYDWKFGFNNSTNPNKKSMNGSCFVFFNEIEHADDTIGSRIRLYSPVFSGLEHRNYFLDMDFIWRKRKAQETFKVYVYDGQKIRKAFQPSETIGGPNFGDDEHLTIDLSAFRSPQMQLMFEYHDSGEKGFWVGIDNVKVTGTGQINDLCSKAIPLTLDADCLPGNNLSALFDGPQPGCADNNVASLWYSFTATETGILKITPEAQFNEVITVFQGNCDTTQNALNEWSCDDRDEFGFEGEEHYVEVVSGQSYFIRISGKDRTFGLPRGSLCIGLTMADSLPSVPANDLCQHAFTLQIDGPCVDATNINAGFEGPQPSLNLKSKADIWFKFIATSDTLLEIETVANFSDVITLFEGNCDNLVEVAGNDLGKSLQVEDLIVGDTFFVQVASYFATTEGSLCTSIRQTSSESPENDFCETAIPILLGEDCVAATNQNATFSGVKPSCEPDPQADIWFTFQAPPSGGVKFNSNADYQHIVTFYQGDSCTQLEEVACIENPMRCAGFVEVLDLTPDKIYWIQISAASTPIGHQFGTVCMELLDHMADDPYLPISLGVELNCIGDGLATLEINPEGGQGDYSFVGNTEMDTLSDGDTYVVVLSDEMGCEVSASGTVNCSDAPCELETNIVFTNVSCFGESDGAATVEVINATDDLAIEWSNGETGFNISDLLAGSYSVTVSDGPVCLIIENVGISEPDIIFANTASTQVSGQGLEDGTASADPVGGTPPYSFLWNTNDTTSTIENLGAGTYTVTIVDVIGCQIVETVEVPDYICVADLDLSIQDVNCFGGSDGVIQVNINGGVGPFSYNWSNGGTSDIISNLEPGVYDVTVTDGNNCSYTESGLVVQPDDGINLTLENTVDNTCYGDSSGIGTISATGGMPPYTIEWSNGLMGLEASDLPAGTYTVFVTDANGCLQTIGVPILEPDDIAFQFNVNHVNCFGDATGSAAVNPTGGNPPYSYLWNDPNAQITFTATELLAGEYQVTITDTEGCSAIGQTEVTELAPIEIQIDSVGPSVNMEETGFVNVTIQGGAQPYTYIWESNGSQVSDDEDLAEVGIGVYQLTVIDANGCMLISEEIIIDGIVGTTSRGILGSSFSVFPNPSKGIFRAYIELDKQQSGTILIFDQSGKIIREVAIMKIDRRAEIPFDLTEVAKGVYTIQLILEKEILVNRMILQ